ncbi:glycosyltransferase [Candidatus Woesearchaeota archaeon]|nr:glycosyltransferase [Candidatus Woesearchaeota archaeon]
MLSIIIPTLNEERYLPKILDSIKKQNFKDYEIIVADFNSKDKTRQIAKKYGCRITKGGLPAAARNNGAKVAKGDILFFIDADCIVKKFFLQKSLNEIKNKNLDAAGCCARPLSNKAIDNIVFAFFNFWICIAQFFYPNAAFGIFCKKDLHRKIKGFDETIKLSEDMDYAKRAGKYGRFRILKGVKIYASVRRFEEEGRLGLIVKLFLSGCYRLLFGEIKTNMFKYGFGHEK